MPSRSKPERSELRAACFPVLSSGYLLLIFGLPLELCGFVWRLAGNRWQIPSLLLCPILYAIAFALIAGLLSVPHQKGIVAGRFPRNVGHAVYFHRRLYGLCWTALYYFKPIYFVVLSINPLRKCIFRLFGYRGNLNFTIYPDTWIRDLPLLSFGEGAYIANRATLGTNICLQSGDILVGGISMGERSVLGHLGVIGLGSRMASNSELGVGTTTGMQVTVGRNTKVGAICGLNHGSSIGDECDIGSMSYVGSGTRVLNRVCLPPSSVSSDHETVQDASKIDKVTQIKLAGGLSNPDKLWLESPEVRKVLTVLKALATDPLKNGAYGPSDNLESDLGLDSLKRVELLTALESEFGVDIEDRVVLQSRTIRELVEGVIGSRLSLPAISACSAPYFCSPPSAADLRFLEARRRISAPLWFLIGRGIELVGRVFFGLRVQGREKLPLTGAFLLCPNHQSYLDPPFILSVLPWSTYKNLFIVGTSEIFGRGIFRLIARTVRLYVVDPNENLLSVMRICALGLRSGMGLLLYPEGEMTVDGYPHPFKRGAGSLAVNLKVPVYPVAIDGFFESWPKGKRFAKFAPLRIKFGDPIFPPEEQDPKKAEEIITETLQDAVTKMWEGLRDERCDVRRETTSYGKQTSNL